MVRRISGKPVWDSLRYRGGQTRRRCRRRVLVGQTWKTHLYRGNELDVCYLADTPLKMKSTDSSRIPADSYSSNLVFRSSFFRCMSTITEFRNSTWELSYWTLSDLNSLGFSIHLSIRNIFAPIERNWIDVNGEGWPSFYNEIFLWRRTTN